MSHELSFERGSAEMIYVGERPWHRLGAKLPERVTPTTALELAGMDWPVEQFTLEYRKDDEAVAVPDRVANVRVNRDGSLVYLGVVSRRYEPIQNAEAAGFIDEVVGKELAMVETAGVLKRGAIVWWLCKLPDDMIIRAPGGEDVSRCYLLLCNGHDGTLAFRMFFTPVRVVCWNTLSWAEGSSNQAGVTLRHMGKIHSKVEGAVKLLNIANKKYQDIGKMFQHLADVHFSEADAKAFFNDLLPDEEDKDTKHTGRPEAREKMLYNFLHGRGCELSRDTVWGAYNAVAEWYDHTRYDGRKRVNHEARFRHIMMSGARAVKQQALRIAAKIVT